MSQPNPEYLHRVSARIVRMFERYVRNISPDEKHFNAFISDYLTEESTKNPQALPYSELYKLIKDGIREYLRQQEPKPRSKK